MVSLQSVILVLALAVGAYYATKRSIEALRRHRTCKQLRSLPPIEGLPNFDWRSEKPRQLRPYKSIYHMSMGIRNEELSNLITVDSEYFDRTSIRRHIIEQYQGTVHGYLPGGEDAVRELYSYLLAHHLPSRFPTMFSVKDGQFHNTITNRVFPSQPPMDPNICLKILAETIEEDIFLLKETETTHVCLAFACCFPTGFDPSEKLGKDLSGIHGPVPSYNKIGPSMERFFRKLKVGNTVRRMNWNVQTGTELINVAGNHIKDGDEFVADEPVDCAKANLRIELQSLTRLPSTKFILFCFKTYLYPLPQIKAEGSGPELADAIEGLKKGNAPDMHKYKSAVRWGKSVVGYLRGEKEITGA